MGGRVSGKQGGGGGEGEGEEWRLASLARPPFPDSAPRLTSTLTSAASTNAYDPTVTALHPSMVAVDCARNESGAAHGSKFLTNSSAGPTCHEHRARRWVGDKLGGHVR